MARVSRKGAALAVEAVQAARVWNAAVYARLSVTDSGRKGSDTIETQIELVKAYIRKHPDMRLFGIYIDNGASGKDFNRPSWNRLIADIRAGRADCVCVKDLSRFSRNYIETCEYIEKLFPLAGVRFVSVNDGYDSARPGRNNETLVLALKSLVHDRYLKETSRKISSVIDMRIKRGDYVGSAAPFGYKRSKANKGRLETDENAAAYVRDIFLWRAEGKGHMAICKMLNAAGIPRPSAHRKNAAASFILWRTATVRNIIRNPVYLGVLISGKTRQSLAGRKPRTAMPESEWVIRENAHEAIVSRELWEAANAVEAERRARFINKAGKDGIRNVIHDGVIPAAVR
jgi:DNA invertase Pin-like site-specific DNA recombinase